MATTTVTANWTKSVDPSVTNQLLQITINNVIGDVINLTPDIETYQFSSSDKSVIHVELWATDGTRNSMRLTADLTVPSADKLIGPTNLTLNYIPFPG